MVYFEPTDLGLSPIIKNWMNTLPKDFPKSGIELLNQLLDFSLQKGMQSILILKYLRFLKRFLYYIKDLSFSKQEKTALVFHSINWTHWTVCLLWFRHLLISLVRTEDSARKSLHKSNFPSQQMPKMTNPNRNYFSYNSYNSELK